MTVASVARRFCACQSFARMIIIPWAAGPACALLGAVLTLSGCASSSASCDMNNLSVEPAPPVITVVNASTHQPICDATVIATCTFFDAGMPLITPASFEPDASTSDCAYGVPEQAADGGVVSTLPLVYSCMLQVSKSGFASVTVPKVAPSGGGCTAGQSQIVQVQLHPD